jgi:hypothetical protein
MEQIMTDMTVATTIFQQLGGRQFQVLTGARNLVGGDDSLSMQVSASAQIPLKNRCTHVRITLDPMDTYTVEFLRFNRKTYEFTECSKHEGVYNDQLKDLFEAQTGLYVTLQPRRA